MKFLLTLVVLLAVAGGVYNWGGNSLDEKQIRTFYEEARLALIAGDDAALCAMVADDYRQSSVLKVESGQQENVIDKQEYCADATRSVAQTQQLRDMLGPMFELRYEQNIKRITLAEDGRSAKVDVTATMELPGMRMVSRSRDVIERKRWRTQATSSVSVIHAGGN